MWLVSHTPSLTSSVSLPTHEAPQVATPLLSFPPSLLTSLARHMPAMTWCTGSW